MKSLKHLFALLFVVFLAACSGGADGDVTAGGVASASDLNETVQDAEDVANDIVAADSGDDAAVSAEDAGLALAQCMRDNGIADFPDPTVDANGNLNLRAALADSGLDFQDEGFREQITACQEEVGADNFGAGARGNQREGIQEQLLSYTQCLRDEGLDVGDIEFGGGAGQGGNGGGQGQNAQGQGQGGNGGGNGDGAGAGRAQGQGGAGQGGGQGGRIANALGLDAEDPATAAALTACEDVLAEAFAGFGGGGGGGGQQQPATTDT